ncbi:MAG: protein translocase subunit SecF [Patescibacteria group bacterium]
MSFVKSRIVWFVLSGVAVAASVAALFTFGLNFGIDFTGGSLLEVVYPIERPAQESVKSALSSLELGVSSVQLSGEQGVIVRAKPLSEEEHQKMLGALRGLGALEEARFDSIGPVIGQELKNKSATALALVLIMIVVYVAWSFRGVGHVISSWKYGALTVLAGLHDIIIPLGVFAILGQTSGVQIGTAFVAALLTILGYSVNDTIVVLDRVRENLFHQEGKSLGEMVEMSIRQTLARSVNTTLTTLLALVAVYIFGGESTKFFALALLIGIAVGAYSSIFIAAPLLVSWEKWDAKRRELKGS